MIQQAGKQVERSCYDYPQYFELAFADETQKEVDFIEAAFDRYAGRRVRRVLEPGCGGGRVLVELARRGYEIVGFDRSRVALAYLRRRLARRKLNGTIFSADLASFQLPGRVDAAVCTFNTFRHLVTEQAALDHLRSVAAGLRRGGLYILGLHLVPSWAELGCIEKWQARRGQTHVHFTLRVVSADRRRRLEQVRISMLVRSPRRTLRARTEFPLRLYTAAQLRQLLRKVPEFELCDVFDFWYEIDQPRQLDETISDTVLVLRKTGPAR